MPVVSISARLAGAVAERRGAVLSVACAGMFLVLLDVTIVNVALPRIARDLGSAVAGLEWVIDGYAVAIASLLLAGGTMGDRFGHRRILVCGFTAFGAASVGCATAPAVWILIAFRVLQGAGAALLLPCTMAVVAETYPERREQARALGTWAAASSIALPMGPILGGVLVGGFGWRLVFWINVPLSALAIGMSLRVIPTRPGSRSARYDGLGVAGVAITLAAAVFAVIAAGRGARAVEWATAAGISVLSALATGWREARVEHPILPMDLLRRRRFTSPNVVALVMNLVVNGELFVVMLYLQDVRGDPPVVAGALVLSIAVPLVALAPVSGWLTASRGPRTAVASGSVLAAFGSFLLLGVPVHGHLAALLAGLGLLGSGAGLVTASVVAAVIRAAPSDRSGLATGVSNTARQMGTACGVALFGAVAGSPAHVGRFVEGLHIGAVLGGALWLVAWLVAITGITVGAADYPR